MAPKGMKKESSLFISCFIHLVPTTCNLTINDTLPYQACRNEKVRKEVAAAIIKAVSTGDVAANAEISKENVVVRFGEAVDGFPLPKGHDHTNVDIK